MRFNPAPLQRLFPNSPIDSDPSLLPRRLVRRAVARLRASSSRLGFESIGEFGSHFQIGLFGGAFGFAWALGRLKYFGMCCLRLRLGFVWIEAPGLFFGDGLADDAGFFLPVDFALAAEVPFFLAGGEKIFGGPHGDFHTNAFSQPFFAIHQHAPCGGICVVLFFVGIETYLNLMFGHVRFLPSA